MALFAGQVMALPGGGRSSVSATQGDPVRTAGLNSRAMVENRRDEGGLPAKTTRKGVNDGFN